MHQAPVTTPQPKRHRPQAFTVFLAAFVAGAAAAVGINQALDIHLAQKKPQVESEPIFVALRSLPQGSPVTIWDVALRDWPKAMLPTTALRAEDSFEGCILRHPLREGQPLLSVQLLRAGGQTAGTDAAATDTTFTAPAPATPVARAVEADLWTPAPVHPAADVTTPPVTRPEPQPPIAAAVVPAMVPTVNIPAPQATPTDVATPAAVVADTVTSAAVPSAPAIESTTSTTADTPAAPSDTPAPVMAMSIAANSDTPAAHVSTPPAEQEPPATDSVGSAAPDVARGEPTLAEPVPGQPTPADTAPPAEVGIESVVAAQSVTTTPGGDAGLEPAPTPAPVLGEGSQQAATAPRAPRDGITRYLVVPERIALQADSGFAESPAPAAVVPPAPAPAPQQAAESRRTGVQSLPPVRQSATTPASQAAGQRSAQHVRPSPPARPQPPQMAQPPRVRQQPGQQPRKPAAAAGTRQATNPSPRGLGAMFPNIAAGIDAMTGGNRKPRTADTGYDEAVATDDPAAAP